MTTDYAGKWNYEKNTYEPYKLPEGCVLFTPDMELKTACAQCGKTILYGDAFTSKEIHTGMGMGYPVCSKCSEREWDRFWQAQEKETIHET